MLENRFWRGNPGASLPAIDALKAVTPKALPAAYFELLAFSNGGEGPLPVDPLWFALHSAEETTKAARERWFDEFFPGLFVFGGNGGGEGIAFDLAAPEPYPTGYFDMVNIGDDSIVSLSPSFDAFMTLVGSDA